MHSRRRSLFMFVCALVAFVAAGSCGNADHPPQASSVDNTGGQGGSTQTQRDAQADTSSGTGGTGLGGAGGAGGTGGAGGSVGGGGTAGADAGAGGAAGCTAAASLTTENCNDGIDNNCNGLVDCMDSDCRATAVSMFGTSCDVPLTTFGRRCDWLGACVCPTGHATESSCGDGVDNDCDGKIDCADPDCQTGGVAETFACDVIGHTCASADSGTCSKCPGGQVQETSCGNSKDDDCDGLIDCADNDCAAVQCGLAPTQVCQGNKCIDLNNAYSIALTPARAAIPADGIAIDPITISLTSSTAQPISDRLVTLTLSGAGSWYGTGFADAGSTLTVRTDSTGTAVVTLLSSAAGGTARVTAVLVGAQTGTVATVEMPVIDSMSLVSMSASLMGVQASGYNEENQITLQLFAPNAIPYPEGLLVTFTHESLAGSNLGPPRSTPVVGPGGIPVSTTTQMTGPNGIVTVTLYSGTAAGTRSVVASATAGGQTKTFTVSNIVIVGAKVNGLHLTLLCNPRNLAALADNNCTASFMDLSSTCTISAADRFGNILGVAKSVTFSSEAGNMGPPATTPNYPDANIGLASTLLKTLGGGLPRDVDPDPAAGEDESIPASPADPCHFRQRNPRDGVVTVIAAMQGEEGFIDLSGNGSYDLGEPFIDLPEPFVDVNDNNQHDPGEPFTDINRNGVWDPENGRWDSDTTIWTEARVVFTSAAAAGPGYSRYTTSGDVGTLNVGEFRAIDFTFTDINLNVLALQPVTIYSASATYGTVSAAVINAAQVRPMREEGFLFSRLYCATVADGGVSTCETACPATAPSCTVHSFLTSFEKRVAGRTLITAIAPGGAAFEVLTTAATSTTTGSVSTSLRATGFVPVPPP